VPEASPPSSTSAAVTPLLDAEGTVAYWDQRHRARGPLLSGGDLAFDHATNEIFYALRVGRLIEVTGDVTSTAAPLRMLDAGCGKGYFTRAIARFGHRVDGIDVSEHAVASCRAEAIGGDSYAVSSLDGWRPPYLYDVVFSIDVLFHVMSDDDWRASVLNLASLVRWGGRLVLADHGRDEDRVWGEYQKTRATWRYVDLLGPRGLRYVGFTPYAFRDSPVGFHVFTRVA
jgi:SAM-dependent methyltransferase